MYVQLLILVPPQHLIVKLLVGGLLYNPATPLSLMFGVHTSDSKQLLFLVLANPMAFIYIIKLTE
jgi:hypothetical protein